MAAISIGIPITITNTNHKLTTSMKATKATNSRGKSATELEEVKEKKKHKFSANEMIPISKYVQKQNKELNATK